MSQRTFSPGGFKNVWGQIKAHFEAEMEDDDTESEEDHAESEEYHMKVSQTPTPFHASPLISIPNTFS